MLQDGDRVDAVEGSREAALRREAIAHEVEARVGGAELLELSRPMPAAVVWVDHRHLVSQARKRVRRERLAGSDLHQPPAGLDIAEDGFHSPAALQILHVRIGPSQAAEVVEAVREVAHRAVGDRGNLELPVEPLQLPEPLVGDQLLRLPAGRQAGAASRLASSALR